MRMQAGSSFQFAGFTLTYLFAGYSYLANSRGGVIQLCPANTGVG
jgi:hypothetical protein